MRVLIAEDSAPELHLIAEAVIQLGHEAAAFKSGDAAWEEYRRNGADVVVSDWLMPGMKGDELCRRIRDEGYGYVYFVMLTGLRDTEHIVRAMQMGADDYLTKPFDAKTFAARLLAAERVMALHRRLAEERLELEAANSRLALSAGRDPLTGLPDASRLRDDLDFLGASVDRYGASIWLAICDIDNFNAYNESNGHSAGDVVLCAVSEALNAGARRSDRAYRIAGERLLVLMTEQDREGAALGAERLRGIVERLEIDHADNRAGVVTVSVGVAGTMGAEATDADDLLRRAEAAVTIAKQSGRNRVVVDGLADAPDLDLAR